MAKILTATVLIGNSDNKLSQREWAAYIHALDGIASRFCFRDIYFSGFSLPDKEWQNACWTFPIMDDRIAEMKLYLAALAKRHNQDSIALVVGETEFIEGGAE